MPRRNSLKSRAGMPYEPLSEDFLGAMREYRRCIQSLAMKKYRTRYDEYVGPGTEGRYLPRLASNDPFQDTKLLALILLACNATARTDKTKRWPPSSTLTSASSRFAEGSWQLASPVLATRHVLGSVVPTAKRKWLRRRNPQVQMFSMLHQTLSIEDRPTPLDVWRSMSLLWLRFLPIVSVILKHVGCGGSANWDIVPKRFGNRVEKETVLVHLHMLVEPYVGSRFVPSKALHRIQKAWDDSAGGGLQNEVVMRPIKHSQSDLSDALLYVHGLPLLSGVRTTKMLAPYIPAHPMADPSQLLAPCRPSDQQMRCLLAFFAYPELRLPRWFGVWDLRCNPGRQYSKLEQAEQDVNDPKLRKAFADLFIPRRHRL